MKETTLEYKPRDQFLPFHRRKQRWMIIVVHRRARQTVATINDLTWRACAPASPRAGGKQTVRFSERLGFRLTLT
jgi:hypothetical protein